MFFLEFSIIFSGAKVRSIEMRFFSRLYIRSTFKCIQRRHTQTYLKPGLSKNVPLLLRKVHGRRSFSHVSVHVITLQAFQDGISHNLERQLYTFCFCKVLLGSWIWQNSSSEMVRCEEKGRNEAFGAKVVRPDECSDQYPAGTTVWPWETPWIRWHGLRYCSHLKFSLGISFKSPCIF